MNSQTKIFTENDLKRKRIQHIAGSSLLFTMGIVGIIFMHDSATLLFASIVFITVIAPLGFLTAHRITKLLKQDIQNPNQQVDPIVKTPVDKVEAQGTQGHP